jgi:hypothetical protein
MSFAPRQFIRSVDFLSTENAINTSTGCVNIYGGMSVSKDSYLNNVVVTGNSTIANLTISGNLRTSTGNSLISSQWTSIDSNTDIYFGTSANAFVGIGTNTPNFTLDISGGSRITEGLTVGSLNVNTGATITNILNSTICTGTIILTTGTLNASFNSNTIGSIITTGGNVGIGITTPDYKLDVNGAIKNNSDIIMSSASKLTLWNNAGPLQIRSYGSNMLYLNQDNTGNISLGLGGGNIGIGTVPAYKLDINGNCKVTNELYVGNADGVGTIYMGGGASYDADYNMSVIESRTYLGDESTELLLFKGNDVSGESGPDRIRLRAGAIAFDTYTSTTIDRTAENIRMYINASGNVGVGTITPEYKLDINGNCKVTNELYVGNADGVGTIYMGGGSSGDGEYNLSVIETRAYLGIDSSEMLLFKGNDHGDDRIRLRAGAIAFDTYTSPTNDRTAENIRMYVNASGNVGIGTITPEYKLDINGNCKVTNELYVGNADGVGTIYMGGGSSGDGAYSLSVIESRTYSGAESTELLLFKGNDNGDDRIRLRAGAIAFDTYSSDSIDRTAENIRMYVNASGNVGINTTSPQTKLHVEDGSVFIGDAASGFSTSVPSTPGSISTANGYRLFFDNSYNSVAGTGMPANKIVLHNNMFTAGFGLEDLAVTYHSGVGHRFYGSANTTNTYGDLVMSVFPTQTLVITNTNSEGLLKIGNSNDGTSAHGMLRIGNNIGDTVIFLNSSTKTDDGGPNTCTIRNDTGSLRLQGSSATNTIFLPGNSTNVGINTSSPSYTLQVAGDIYASGDVISFSDSRLKTDISTINNALDKVSDMRGVYYTNLNTQNRETGVIAQEMAEILPEVVADRGEYLGVAYGNIVGILIEAIKELKARVVKLENR